MMQRIAICAPSHKFVGLYILLTHSLGLYLRN